MNFLLRHITQMHLLTVILLSVGAVCMWIPSFMGEQSMMALASLLLSILNAVLLTWICYRRHVSRMIEPFAGMVYLVSVSALIPWHSCWAGHLVVSLLLITYMILLRVDRHQVNSAAEEAFLSVLVLVVASYWMPVVLVYILVLIGILVSRQAFDGQAFLAILIGLMLGVVYAGILVYWGWIEPVWVYGFSTTYLLRTIPSITLIISMIAIRYFYSGETMIHGITFFIYLALCIAAWITLLCI